MLPKSIAVLLLDASSFKAKDVVTSVAFAFKFNATCVLVEIGLSKSDVLSTLPKPTLDGLIPLAILLSITAPSANFIDVIP